MKVIPLGSFDHSVSVLRRKRIDLKTLKDLMQFGYTEKQAAVALVKTDNNSNLALDVS